MKKLRKIYLFFFITLFIACNDPYENTLYQVFDINPVSTYLENNRSEEFSEWIKILKYADLFNAINQASEMFTVFVPDNQAVHSFYQSKGVISIEELGLAYARDLAKYHIIADSVNLETFVIGGKLESKTLSDDYLTVTFDEDSEAGGFNSLYVNNEAKITEAAISVSNGYVYTMNAVLSPLVESVYDRIQNIESTPGIKKYTLFKEILDLTSWADTLNTIYVEIREPNGTIRQQKRDYTLFAVSDETFKNEGISSVDDLREKLEQDVYDDDDESALFKYAAYHIITGNYSLFDLKTFDGNSTKKLLGTAANAVMELSLQNDNEYFINYDGVINNESVKAMFIEESSDVQAKNGMLHDINAYLPLWESIIPVSVEWDFCDHPEVAAFITTNGTEGQKYQTAHSSNEYRTEITDLSIFQVDRKSSATPTKSFNYVDYFTVKETNDWSKSKNKDQLILNLGYTGSISMKSPIVIQGKYKVTLHFAFASSMDFMRTQSSGSNGGLMQFVFDDDVDNKAVQIPIYASVPEKRLGLYETVIFDEIEFSKTSSHKFKMVVMDPSAATNSSFRILLT